MHKLCAHFLVTSLLLASSTEAITNDIVYNDAKFSLELREGTDNLPYGHQGDVLGLEFMLRNRGKVDRTFEISLQSGLINMSTDALTFPADVKVTVGSTKVIFFDGFKVPENAPTGSKSRLTVIAVSKKVEEYNWPQVELRKTVLFTVGRPSDDTRPEVIKRYGPKCSRLVSDQDPWCHVETWRMDFDVQDEESGLSVLEIHALGGDKYPIKYSYGNFHIGTEDQITVQAIISCCTSTVVMTAVNVSGLEERVLSIQPFPNIAPVRTNYPSLKFDYETFKEEEKKKKKKSLLSNPWIIAAIVVAIIILIILCLVFGGGCSVGFDFD